MKFEEEHSTYSKEEIEEKMRRVREERMQRQPKVKKPFLSPSTKAAIKKRLSSAGGFVKRKIEESQDVDAQITKNNKKAQLAEAKARLAKAQKKLIREQNLGYNLGGPMLGNQQMDFEAGFGDMLAGKKHPRKAKKSSRYAVSEFYGF